MAINNEGGQYHSSHLPPPLPPHQQPQHEPTYTFSHGEAMRQIQVLWDNYRRLEEKLEATSTSVAAISSQMPYIVTLLEKMERSRDNQAPACAVRGARMEALEVCSKEVRITIGNLQADVDTLMASNRILKWVIGIVGAVLTIVGAEKVLDLTGRH